jgi:hypothetical protein
VDPAGKPRGNAGVGKAQGAASMGAIGVHQRATSMIGATGIERVRIVKAGPQVLQLPGLELN